MRSLFFIQCGKPMLSSLRFLAGQGISGQFTGYAIFFNPSASCVQGIFDA
ncbi:hypothetical protein ACP8HI_17765 [Paenibacillus sp. FA6]